MSAEAPIPEYEESHTSAAIDGARIACMTALILVELDRRLDDAQKAILMDGIETARMYLDAARQCFPVQQITSLHHVREEPRIIIPR